MNTASVKAASVRRSQVTMIQCARFLRGLIADYHTVVFGWPSGFPSSLGIRKHLWQSTPHLLDCRKNERAN